MRYQKGHKEETHQRIVGAASQRFRKEGAESVGVAGLMADAGLTHGGFYAHFNSKEDLFCEAVTKALADTTAEFERATRNADHGLEVIVRGYLSLRHRNQPEQGCAGASLAAEVARHPKHTRQVFSESIDRVIDLIETHIPATEPGTRRQRATAIFALMMGALQLARAEPDEARSRAILENAVEAALELGRGNSS